MNSFGMTIGPLIIDCGQQQVEFSTQKMVLTPPILLAVLLALILLPSKWWFNFCDSYSAQILSFPVLFHQSENSTYVHFPILTAISTERDQILKIIGRLFYVSASIVNH
jgi:hypothetical protein